MHLSPKGDDSHKIIDQILEWHSIAHEGGAEHQLSALALAFGGEVEHLISGHWRALLEAEATKIIAELAWGINDYGNWRASRGNPSFEEYVAAKDGHSKEIKRHQKAITEIDKIERYIKYFLGKFDTTESLVHLCADFRSVTMEMATQSWKADIFFSAVPEARDIALCLAWAGIDVEVTSNAYGIALIKNNLSNYDACRLLSARVAEIAVASYYRGLNKKVDDISVTQLDKGDQRWKDFDLLADDKPLDVKNARQSFSSPDTYVEHCVPRFKTDRQSGDEVSIVGVLSDYTSDAESIIAGKPVCRVLGQVNVSEIRLLFVWMRRRFGKFLNLDGLWNEGYLPGWIFEFPARQYERRQVLIAHIEGLLAQFSATSALPVDAIPGWLFAMSPNHVLVETLELPKRQKEMLADLASLDKAIGLTRPSLYVYSMGILLEAMVSDSDPDEVAKTLKSLIFVDGKQSSIPLGLIDTQTYIACLIALLLRVSAEAKHQNIRFVAFQMPHPAILRGQLANGKWMTLIAYCGGWRDEPFRVKCGAAPLFFGEHKVCPSCGRLVCSYCGFCSERCELAAKRQAEVTRLARQGFVNSDSAA